MESRKNLDRECLRLIKVFKDVSIQLNNKKKVKQYFNFHQRNLVILMDEVSMEIPKERNRQEKKFIDSELSYLLEKMGNLLEWMDQMCPQIFDYKSQAPIKVLQSEKSKIRVVLDLIKTELEAKCIDDKLSELTTSVLDPEQISTFRDIRYWQTTAMNLYSKIISNTEIDKFGIIKVLIGNGINHRDFFSYSKAFILKEIEKKTTLSDQISAICTLRKEIRMLLIETKSRQFQVHPDINKLVRKFIREELLLLRAMEFVNHETAEAGIMNANYKVSFSVKQLAFFFHLQMETGIIIWQRAKFAHQYIARHFSTIERESISEKSARNAHYSHASEDIKKVITKLSEMLALAQERY
ncbi:hypothetical protein [Pedobacter sp. MR22-3]|uniref:hypothetical protein n=1 Tax=Pedobacter sp. MR22-3 TaxID=2994552 RepID=UPI00224714AD|nr:hypothetical protein [Pedobacter sp. MR22-3]MCX2584332.1 hypothetical protein [Pedobacter sp. MR22-3]